MALEQNFVKASELFEVLVNRGNDRGIDVLESCEFVRGCIAAVKSASVFSENEELDDVQTGVLKFFHLEYFLARMLTQVTSMDQRAACLSAAKKSLEIFLRRAFHFGLMHEDEVKTFEAFFPGSTDADVERRAGDKEEEEEGQEEYNEDAVVATATKAYAPPPQSRDEKIAKFKREKECKQRIDYLQGKVRIRRARTAQTSSSSGSSSGSSGSSGSEDDMLAELELGDEEEELRELYLLQFGSFIRGGLDELSLIGQELDMLRHMAQMRKNQPPAQGAEAEAAARTRVSESVWQDQVKRGNIMGLPGQASTPYSHGDSPGIEVTRTGKSVDGQLLMRKEVVKAGVFKDSIAPPTMSLAQFGDLEKVSSSSRSSSSGGRSRGRRGRRRGGAAKSTLLSSSHGHERANRHDTKHPSTQ
jgi:hypothetical protein